MRQPSSPTFLSWLSDHPMGQASSAICLSLTASSIVTLILVALAASRSGWTRSNRSGKASANICWNFSRMSAEASHYGFMTGRQTPRVALKTGLSGSRVVLADENPPRRRKMVQETMKEIKKAKNSSFWERDLSVLRRGSRPLKFGLKLSSVCSR